MYRERQIKRRLTEATAGPWKVHDIHAKVDGTWFTAGRAILTEWDHPGFNGPAPVFSTSQRKATDSLPYCSKEDAEFIVHAADDMEYLLVQVERMRTALEQVQECKDKADAVRIAKEAIEELREMMSKRFLMCCSTKVFHTSSREQTQRRTLQPASK